MSATPTHGLLDGDIIVYRVGFASEDVDERIALSRVDTFIDNVMIGADLTTIQGFITGSKDEDPTVENYRNIIATTLPYKGNRPSNKPKHYNTIRRYLDTNLHFSYEKYQEADDAIAIEGTKRRDDVVICSIDKDLRQVPGFHYNFVTNKLDYVTDDEGLRNFYRQILTGDRVDNIPGLDGIGPVKAAKIIPDDMVSEEQMYFQVVSAYQHRYSDSPIDSIEKAVLERGQLLWLRREPNQLWKPPAEYF